LRKPAMRFSKTVLANGVRVISERVPGVESVSIGIWVHVGSRDEPARISGVSHLIEHMVFKGTKKRSAVEIAEALESLGGSINAFTSREHTCYYVRILSDHLPKAMEILGDMLNNAVFSARDLRKERQVIIEEINDVIDTPSDYVHDLFVEQMWDSHPLGQPIFGKAKTVRSLDRERLLDFFATHYQSANIVVAATGDVSHPALVGLSEKYFRWPASRIEKDGALPEPGGVTIKANAKKSTQTHVCLGFPSFGFPDERRYLLSAINTYLSSGMSARLFQKVREEAGLCYSIYSYQDFFRDSGFFCVYFGADAKQVIRATNIVLKELSRLKETLLGRADMAKIKEQLKGSMTLSQESMYNRMNRIAQHELLLNAYIELSRQRRIVDSLTARQIRDMANLIFDRDKMTLCSLGPTTRRDLQSVRWSRL